LKRFPEAGAAGALIHVKLREDLKVHPICQAEFEIRVAKDPGASPYPFFVIQRPVPHVAFDLKNTSVDCERTIGLARSVRVVSTQQINRRWIKRVYCDLSGTGVGLGSAKAPCSIPTAKATKPRNVLVMGRFVLSRFSVSWGPEAQKIGLL